MMKVFGLLFGGLFILAVGLFVGRDFLAPVTQAPTPTPTPAQQVYITTPTITPSPSLPSSSYTTSTGTTALPTAGGGPQNDIRETQQIYASQQVAQVGDDVTFTVTIQNQAATKKFLQAICFNSNDGNFGCVNGKNLAPWESFTVSDSTRFTTPGVKHVWINWTQDNFNFYRPVGAGVATVTIQG